MHRPLNCFWFVGARHMPLLSTLGTLLLFLGCSAQATRTGDSNELFDCVVEVACGECLFQMKGEGCDLAIRIDGKSYYVDSSSIDDHGDAHAVDGLCNAVRTAKATGSIQGDRFLATKLELCPK